MLHLLDVRVVEQNPDFHLGMEEERRIVMSIVTDEADKMEPGRRRPITVHQRIKHLKISQETPLLSLIR